MRLALMGFLLLVAFGVTEAGYAQENVANAWDILRSGYRSHRTRERVDVVRALAELPGNLRAVSLAEQAMADKKPEVRRAAACTLGTLGSYHSIPLLEEALKDKEAQVNFAASSALLSLGEPRGYAVYYELLIGERKTGESALADEKRLVKDPKALTLMGLEVAIGFAPYAGYGWAMYQTLAKDYDAPILVDAAKKLANDPDPRVGQALVKAASTKNWKVRVAALEAIAHRGDPRVLDAVLAHVSDKNHAVRCAAAAAVVRLSTAKQPEMQQASALP
jgi:HEAT repeat protein